MSEVAPDGRPAAAAPPESRGCAIVGLAVLSGAALGMIVGGPAGFIIGLGWLELVPHPSAGRELGLLLLFFFMPLGAILGTIVGAILLGRRAARRNPTRVDRILVITSIILAALAVPGLLFVLRLGAR